MTHLTSITHSSGSSKEQSGSSFATDMSLYLTSFGRSAGLYNTEPKFCIFLACFMRISLFYVFRCFLTCVFCFFCFANLLSQKWWGFGLPFSSDHHSRRNCHWDGLWQGVSVPWTAAENSFSCKAEFGGRVQALGVMRYTHLHTTCSGLARPRAMFLCLHALWVGWGRGEIRTSITISSFENWLTLVTKR